MTCISKHYIQYRTSTLLSLKFALLRCCLVWTWSGFWLFFVCFFVLWLLALVFGCLNFVICKIFTSSTLLKSFSITDVMDTSSKTRKIRRTEVTNSRLSPLASVEVLLYLCILCLILGSGPFFFFFFKFLALLVSFLMRRELD